MGDAQYALRPDVGAALEAPRVIAGSHDPLLEWAIRESECDCAMLVDGSLDGIKRLTTRQAMASGLHILDAATGGYNIDLVQQVLGGFHVVLLEWAQREQGLILACGNPHKIEGLADLRNRSLRFVDRQQAAGSYVLFTQLLKGAGMSRKDINLIEVRTRSETGVEQWPCWRARRTRASALQQRAPNSGSIFYPCIASAMIWSSHATTISSRRSNN
ncbi:MAG: substrate-binding domain-containing protein, partial [Pseudomonadota bacterium]|nr:substrate-binding domain-containing protein [Pseudomonadota bacterium]